ncbi:MAG TPA: NADH-quinone oxidoreductase subunit M [Bryobacteraceae bacterium]|jgi:NADH-quinone oxidoreductase subunit M|nr:NADH-quinone oxidoreductase subunit M [Bryobacteraceae bacterium]
MNLLTLLIALPAVGFVLTLLIPRAQEQAIRLFTLAVSLLTFVLSLGLATGYQSGQTGQQFVADMVWIANPEIHWHVGIDGLSLWLIILSTFLTPIAILISWRYIGDRVKEFFAFLLLLEFGLVGVFSAWDLFLFYVFWEVALVPMYFLIGIWGHDRRIYAAVKFFLYTMAGSVLMLAAIIFLYLRAGTFDYAVILDGFSSGRISLTHTEETLLFLAFFVAFAIKVPLFPLHTWLPDAHVEAPSAGSLMLASVMLKMGTYGIVRFCLPMFPTAARENAGWIVILAIIGIIYGALVAMVQPNMKKLVAYSSVSHLGFVVLGIFSFTQLGLDGAVYQMLNHGISTGALFILVGFLYERRHSLAISDYGGVATVAPWISAMFLITTLASIGLPTLNNFIGEFLILQGSAQAHFTWTIFAALGVILSACYMLWMYQRVFFGETHDEVRHHISDFNMREWACVIPLVIMMVWMGMYTQTFLPPVSEANSKILDQSKMNVPLRVALPSHGLSAQSSGGSLHAR